MLEGIHDYHDFEELVVAILERTLPKKLDYRDGGRDRGRDIVAEYVFQGKSYTVIVECKYYSGGGVGPKTLAGTVVWATAHQPDLLYFWTYPYLTNDSKDLLSSFREVQGFSVEWEDGINIESYLRALSDRDQSKFIDLRRKIEYYVSQKAPGNEEFLEYDSVVSKDYRELVDRVSERAILSDIKKNRIFVHGVSGSGKTALVKSVARDACAKGWKVFWHTFQPNEPEEEQLASLMSSLACYFSIKFSESRLKEYFDRRGYMPTASLITLFESLLYEHKALVILDDCHRCKEKKIISFLTQVAAGSSGRLIMMGWYSPLPFTPPIERDVCFLPVKGLEPDALGELYLKVHSKPPDKQLLTELANEYDSLPIYAVIAKPSHTTSQSQLPKLHGLCDYLMEDLSDHERKMIDIFSVLQGIARTFQIANLSKGNPIQSLIDKRIVVAERKGYRIHDSFRRVFSERLLEVGLDSESLLVLKRESKNSCEILISLIMYFVHRKEFLEALDLIDNEYRNLIDHGFELQLLQAINDIVPYINDISGLIRIKALVLERMGQYQTARDLLSIYGGNLDPDNIHFAEWEYARYRLDYFGENISKVGFSISERLKTILGYDTVNRIQILFILGRIYYVQGRLDDAAAVYFYALQFSIGVDRELTRKAVHRIAMIAEIKGYDREALTVFQALLNSTHSLKRKSFIWYRIGKCHYKLGELSEARNACDESRLIKESIGHQRGLIFCHKLSSKISLKQGDFDHAVGEAEAGCELARTLHLKKELVSCGLALMATMRQKGISDREKYDSFKCELIAYAEELGLTMRVKQLKALNVESSISEAVNGQKITKTGSMTQSAEYLKRQLNPYFVSILESFVSSGEFFPEKYISLV
jgi:tetratricopeptide (TPR) repeat protein